MAQPSKDYWKDTSISKLFFLLGLENQACAEPSGDSGSRGCTYPTLKVILSVRIKRGWEIFSQPLFSFNNT